MLAKRWSSVAKCLANNVLGRMQSYVASGTDGTVEATILTSLASI